MTLPRFGKIVPLQGDVLELAGYVLSRNPDAGVVPKTDAERIEIVRRGRAALVKRTGHDFGYDLARWVQFLETNEECREKFTHPYAYRTTKRWIQTAMADLDRQRLVSLIEPPERSQTDS
jgi:hypothetical protein